MALTDTQKKYITFLKDNPVKVGHWLGFDKLTDLHGEWIRSFVYGKDDETLLAHRGSYKTTCVSIAIAIIIIIFPNDTILFMRKTDDDVQEVIEQVRKMLLNPVMQFIVNKIYGTTLKLIKSNANELHTNLSQRASGTVQLMGIGVNGSLTGKHFERIMTDDIVNLKDRLSRAEREHTKQVYMELQNIRNRGGKITNTGTPWHKDDCFQLMPPAKKYDCYSTGLISPDELAEIRAKTAPSLFAANYELLHIASEGALFNTPPRFVTPEILKAFKVATETELLYNGITHIDAAYGGEDRNALTLGRKIGDTIFMLGKVRSGHIDNHVTEFLEIKDTYRCGSVYMETNADKGYVLKDIKTRGHHTIAYHETMNKYYKISTHLRGGWKNVVFLNDTDKDYIAEIMDYTEDSTMDDCCDGAANICRKFGR